MELKEFIKATITSIQSAVVEATEETGGLSLNPVIYSTKGYDDTLSVEGGHIPVTTVKFDVAVVENSADSAGGSAGISILPFKASAQGEVSNAQSNSSRIQFEIRMALPWSDTQSKPGPLPDFKPRSVV